MIITYTVSFDAICMILAEKPLTMVTERFYLKIIHEPVIVCLS
jgi:hypothetical protein